MISASLMRSLCLGVRSFVRALFPFMTGDARFLVEIF